MSLGIAQPRRAARETPPYWRQPEALIVSVAGSSGSGKTALLEVAAERLSESFRTAVIVANLAATRDVERLKKHAQYVREVQAAEIAAERLSDLLAPQQVFDFDFVLIESIDGLIETPGSNLPPVMHVGVFSVSGGDDKAAKHPQCVRGADLILLTKVDLLRHVHFDMGVFLGDVRRINPSAPLLEVSISQGIGLDDWVNWLRRSIQMHRGNGGSSPNTPQPEWFFG